MATCGSPPRPTARRSPGSRPIRGSTWPTPRPSATTYVSVAGRARVVDDRAKARQLWSPAMQVFFPGGVDDPQLRLIHVRAESAEYWDSPAGLFGAALEFVLGAVEEEQGVLTENRVLDLGRR